MGFGCVTAVSEGTQRELTPLSGEMAYTYG